MKNANDLSVVVLSACVLLGGRVWGVESTPEGGSFHDGTTWVGGTVPGTGSNVALARIRGTTVYFR